ncbi:MAG TPA: tetratricopeptide repeat protein [Bacteroidales bacterium]|nr:tetratricopeptide repeat protein [Bacteroidales bacterium]
MKKTVLYKIIFLFLIVTFRIAGFAQQHTADSLLRIVETAPTDSAKVHALYHLADYYSDKDNTLYLKYARQGLALAEEIGYEKGISFSLNNVGNAYYDLGKFNKALVCYEKRLELATKLKDSVGVAASKDNIAIIYLHQGELQKALEYRKQSNELYEMTGNHGRLANGYVWIGNIYLQQADYESAVAYYLKARRIFAELDSEEELAIVYVNLCSVFKNLLEFKKALWYGEQAAKLFRNAGHLNGEGVALYRLSLIYSDLKQYEKSVEYLLQAKELFTIVQNGYFLNQVTLKLAYNYTENGEYEQALEYYNKGLNTAVKEGDLGTQGVVLTNIGSIYYEKGEYEEALPYLRQADKILQKTEEKRVLSRTYVAYILTFSNLHEQDSVFAYITKYVALRDSMITEQTLQAVAELQTKYDTEKKEKEIALLNLENERKQSDLDRLNQLNRFSELQLRQAQTENLNYQQSLKLAEAETAKQQSEIQLFILNEEVHNQARLQARHLNRIIFTGFTVIIIVLAFTGYLILLAVKNKKEKEKALLQQTAADLNRQLMEMHMKALNFQLNPHFIFNCVHSVEYLLKESKTEESMVCLRKFSNLTRLMLESMSKQDIPLEQELEIVTAYMDLELTRSINSFTYAIDLDPTIDLQTTMVPPLILQPFIENSIKHGFVNAGELYEIRLYLKIDNKMLLCDITDNGIGYTTSRNGIKKASGYKKESLGLKLTEDRLRVINQMKLSQASFTIQDLQTEENKLSGTRVLLSLPYISAV